MLPLAGFKVIEFCQFAAGPFAGMLLADMGADLIKVEPPDGGDNLREWPPHNNGYSEAFASINRNKRSVALDLKNSVDLARARLLVESADVVLENFRPGVLDRLGLGYEQMHSSKPSLVYCSISAFGQTGPRAQEGGFDLTIQAMGGVMSVTGEPDGEPVKCGVPLSDFTVGLYAAFAVAAALHKVRRGEPGEHIDVSMLGTTLAIAALQTSGYFGTGVNPAKLGSAHPRNAPYQAFRCRDGYFAMAAGNDRLWTSMCEGIQRPDLLGDERFASVTLRAQNQAVLRQLLEADFMQRPAQELLALFSGRGVPCAPINSYSEALQDPQVQHMGWVKEMVLPGGGRSKTFTSPLHMSATNVSVYRAPPMLGEHNEEVLAEIGQVATPNQLS